MSCEHPDFLAAINVGRITFEEGGPVEAYVADIAVKCSKCGCDFIWNWTDKDADPNVKPMSIKGQKTRPWVSGMGTILGCTLSPVDKQEPWMMGNVPTMGSA